MREVTARVFGLVMLLSLGANAHFYETCLVGTMHLWILAVSTSFFSYLFISKSYGGGAWHTKHFITLLGCFNFLFAGALYFLYYREYSPSYLYTASALTALTVGYLVSFLASFACSLVIERRERKLA